MSAGERKRSKKKRESEGRDRSGGEIEDRSRWREYRRYKPSENVLCLRIQSKSPATVSCIPRQNESAKAAIFAFCEDTEVIAWSCFHSAAVKVFTSLNFRFSEAFTASAAASNGARVCR